MRPSALEDDRLLPRHPLNDAEVMSTKAPIVLPLLLAFLIFLGVGAAYEHFPKPSQATTLTASQTTPGPPVAAQLSLVSSCDDDC